MNAETFQRVADLVRERPYLSPHRPELFESARRDHETPSVGCTGGPHCWVEMQARDVLSVVGAL